MCVCVCVCVCELLCCILETNTFEINYTPIENKKFKKHLFCSVLTFTKCYINLFPCFCFPALFCGLPRWHTDTSEVLQV